MDPTLHTAVWHAVLGGALLAITIAAPPGPVMTVMANCSMQGRIKEALRTVAGAILGDVMWLALAVIGAAAFLDKRPHVVGIIGLVGAALLAWMGWHTWRTAHHGVHKSNTPGSLKLGFFMVLTSPFSLAWWLANGTLLYTAWGWPGIAAFFATGILYSLAFVYTFRWIGRRAMTAIVWVAYVSAVVLVGFGGYVAWTSVHLLYA